MTLPALRLAFLRGWPAAGRLAAELREALLGRVIALPAALGEPEREAVVDAAALLLDLPARPLVTTEGALPGSVYVLPSMVDAPPQPVPGALVLCVVRRAGPPRLDLTPEVRLLRDGIIEHWGLQHSGTTLQWIAAWMGAATDSPGTAIRFASAALARQLAEPDADEAALYLAGLASTIGWLLRGVDARVAQWVLAIAAQAPDAGRVVSTEAALLGRDAALLRAFEAGLLQILPEEPEEHLALRRPLEALSELADAPGAPSLAAAAAALAPHLSPEVHLVLERLLRPATRKLGLEGPPPPRPLVGREEVLQRLVTLCEPAREVRTTILYGLDGMGKSAVAASLCELLASQLTPVWVRFAKGAEAGWLRVLDPLMPNRPDGANRMLASGGVRGWVLDIHDHLRQGPYLVVIEEADVEHGDELPAWLPSGEGSCVVLVLSRRAQRELQRQHDAIAVRLGPLSLRAARSLLASKVPHLAEDIDRGMADRLINALGQDPAVLSMASSLLQTAGLDTTMEVATTGGRAVLVQEALNRLTDEELRMLSALTACDPTGSPRELPLIIAGSEGAEDVLSALEDRSFVLSSGHCVLLDSTVRVEMQRRIQSSGSEPALHLEHALAVHRLIHGKKDRWFEEKKYDLHWDADIALRRLEARIKAGEIEHAGLFQSLMDP